MELPGPGDVLYVRAVVVIWLIYNSVYLLTPNSSFIQVALAMLIPKQVWGPQDLGTTHGEGLAGHACPTKECLPWNGFLSCFFFFFFFLSFFRATFMAYGGSQARGPVGAVATGYTTATATWDLSHMFELHHSHSNAGSLTH